MLDRTFIIFLQEAHKVSDFMRFHTGEHPVVHVHAMFGAVGFLHHFLFGKMVDIDVYIGLNVIGGWLGFF